MKPGLHLQPDKSMLTQLHAGNALFQAYHPGENIVFSAALIKAGISENRCCIYFSDRRNKEILLMELE